MKNLYSLPISSERAFLLDLTTLGLGIRTEIFVCSDTDTFFIRYRGPFPSSDTETPPNSDTETPVKLLAECNKWMLRLSIILVYVILLLKK